MDPQAQSTETVLPPEGMTPVTTPAPANPPPTTQPAARKVVSMPTDVIAKIRQEEREKGKRKALKELEARAKALGFSSLEAMEQAAAKRSARPAAQSPQTATPESQPAPQVSTRADKEKLRLEQERIALRRQAAQADKRRREAQREVDKMRAEMTLREAAIRSGVVDADYALHVLRTDLARRSPEELSSFDEDAFFADLRSKKPHLFNVVREPANTTPSVRQPAPLPNPVPAPGEGQPLDAKSLSRDAYKELLRKRGINVPELSM